MVTKSFFFPQMKSHKEVQCIQHMKVRLFWLNWGLEAQNSLCLASPSFPAIAWRFLLRSRVSGNTV